VAIAGNRAYLTASWGGLRVLDISNPAAPIELGSYAVPGWAWDVAVVGNLAYVSAGGGLHIIDVSDPNALHEEGVAPMVGARGVCVVGSRAYVADWNGDPPSAPPHTGLRIVDVSNPAAPQEIGYYAMPFVETVQVVGTTAYLAGIYDVRVLDVSDPTQITELCSYPSNYSFDLVVSGRLVYVADGDKLRILRYVGDTAPEPLAPPAGGTVTSGDGTVAITAPPTMTEPLTITYTGMSSPSESAGSLQMEGTYFRLDARDASGAEVTVPASPFSLVVHYDPATLLAGTDENALQIYRFDTAANTWVPLTVLLRDPAHDTITVLLDHFSAFALGVIRVVATPNVLWPPNHKLVTVKVSSTGEAVEILSVTSNEPDNGQGDGDEPGDIRNINGTTVQLRAERGGNGPGRIYTLVCRVTDGAGVNVLAVVQVAVPHDQGKKK
jgi:hypothetical protein